MAYSQSQMIVSFIGGFIVAIAVIGVPLLMKALNVLDLNSKISTKWLKNIYDRQDERPIARENAALKLQLQQIAGIASDVETDRPE